MKFIHHFSHSLSCEMIVADAPPPRGEAHIRDVQWAGKPKPKHIGECVRWCHVVNSRLADLWNLRLLHVVQTGPKLREFWAYEPGKPAKLLEKISTH